jgi:uncharacterized protein (DUF433 family)/DNA-binding transcriptional MerR regulator
VVVAYGDATFTPPNLGGCFLRDDITSSISMTSAEQYVGVGLYTLRDAARLLAVPMNTLRYWSGESNRADAMVARQFRDDHLLTFAELMELHFVKLFRDKNVSLQAIRKAAKAASRKFQTDYPFTVKQFNTDGNTIFATLKSRETDKVLIEDLQHGQLVFKRIILPFFKKLEYKGTNEAERFWPMQKRGRIVLDPLRRFGQPIDAETGVPTQAIISALKAGDGQDAPEVAKWFDIPLEAVKAAWKFERSLAS